MSAEQAHPLPHERPLSILTWHIHGSYLNYLAYCGHDFYVPVLPGRPERFGGRPSDAPWPPNIQEMPAEELRDKHFDVILYQHHLNWTEDRHRWLSERQLASIPQALIEHDPPRESPTETRHPVDDENVVVVHVTNFNQLMWDCGDTPVRVIEHGVAVPDDAVWTGERERGLAVVNNIASRGRRLGLDVLQQMRDSVPVDLVGMNSELGEGFGEVPPSLLPYQMAQYRFLFNPIRYTSLGLAVCEAMMVGAPIVGLATTEMSVAVENGVSGFVHTDVSKLGEFAQELIEDRALAQRLSDGARERAREHYGIGRFAHDWDSLLREMSERTTALGRPARRTGSAGLSSAAFGAASAT